MSLQIELRGICQVSLRGQKKKVWDTGEEERTKRKKGKILNCTCPTVSIKPLFMHPPELLSKSRAFNWKRYTFLKEEVSQDPDAGKG